MDALIEAMSDKDLLGMREKHVGNDTVTALIDGIIVERKAKAREVEATAKFEDKVTKLFATLPHPEAIHNVIANWREVEVDDTTAEPEMVDIVDTQVVLDKDGKVTTPAVTHEEQRYPQVKVFKWVVETNHACRGGSGGSTGTPVAKKRGITVSKRDATNPSQLVLVGHFPSASKACDHLKLIVAGDSAVRVIQREGMFIEPYDGTEYTSS